MMAHDANRDNAGPWHDLNVSSWTGTKQSLHLYSQMLGKIRLALSPPQPNWLENVRPIFQQYADLYPVMRPIVDLGNYGSDWHVPVLPG